MIWSYLELFGDAGLKSAVFVDQAPLQNKTDDWAIGSKGCYDAESLAALQAALHADMAAFADGARLRERKLSQTSRAMGPVPVSYHGTELALRPSRSGACRQSGVLRHAAASRRRVRRPESRDAALPAGRPCAAHG